MERGLDMLPHLPGPQFLHLSNGYTYPAYLMGLQEVLT